MSTPCEAAWTLCVSLMMCAFLRKCKLFLLVVIDNLITIVVCVILDGNMLCEFELAQ